MQESPDMRYMAARLMPTWGDSLEEQQQQYPALLSLLADQITTMQQRRMPTDEPSFNQWARSLRMNPTGAVGNLVAAMQHVSVANLAARHKTPDTAAKGDADQLIEV